MTADFGIQVRVAGFGELRRKPTTTLQVNVGKVCNQACNHCHVGAGPKRTETMSQRTADRVIQLLGSSADIGVLDITGGAPELSPVFRQLVLAGRARGCEVIDRCNLTVLFEPRMQGLAQFLADNQVRVVASMPCYSEVNVDKQRGRGVFTKSIDALRLLNAVGYGEPGSGLLLDLVYNPGGAFLPPAQASLEDDYKFRLQHDFSVKFSSLLTLTNLPVLRFADHLRRTGQLESYMQLLVQSFNPATIEGLMCRDMVSVSWDGGLYDCDFNQMLEIPLGSVHRTIWSVSEFDSLNGQLIATDSHCFGCTAGAGSSCGGALAG
ncbi:MAG: radical SAM/Cys-rich protein [Kiritimatiellia bacterium]|jgi:radical SAM/Cys-rich protein